MRAPLPLRRLRRPWRAVPAVALAVVALTGCAVPNFGAPDPVARQGEQILGLWKTSMVIGIGVAALVWGLIAYSVIRFRRRSDDLPSQHPHNIPLEVVYTVTPLLIVAGLFAVTARTQADITDVTGTPDLAVGVVGFQWGWQFRYDGFTITGTDEDWPEMVLPVGRTVRLRLDSTDVVHSFWVPRFLAKRDLIPGLRNEMDIDVDEPGEWVGRCAEFCGLEHWRMRFSVRAVPPAEFEAWRTERRAEAEAEAEAGAPPMARRPS